MSENKITTASEKLAMLRALMAEKSLDGYIIPRGDEYQGEFPASYAERLRWLTGFSGSAGIACILMDTAVVMSDPRYTIQLKNQLDPALYDNADSTKTNIAQWVARLLCSGALGASGASGAGRAVLKIGFDPALHTESEIAGYRNVFAQNDGAEERDGIGEDHGVLFVPVDGNLVDEIWMNQPARPCGLIESFPNSVAGHNPGEKVAMVTSALAEQGCDALLVTQPDSIAWLLNIRGRDTGYIPLALSTLIVRRDGGVIWFIDERRLPSDFKMKSGVDLNIYDPNRIVDVLGGFNNQRIWADGRTLSVLMAKSLRDGGADIYDEKDPCILLRACKTKEELEAMRTVHIADGVAVCRFLKWCEDHAVGKTEVEIADHLHDLRAAHRAFQFPSFPTICGYGPNGAIIHYRAQNPSCAMVQDGNLLLVDSGGQYAAGCDGIEYYGTTDITRTIAIGHVAEEMRRSFTLVLRGMIDLSRAEFDHGTTGRQLDDIARKPLLDAGLNYAHGTGHGVGCYLSVHEEAANISPRGNDAPLPGMVLSNEPGYYKEGEYGIRIENLIAVQEIASSRYGFETLTLAPIDRSLICEEMLDGEQIKWLNAYHERVFRAVSPYLDVTEKAWLEAACAPIIKNI